MNQRDNARIGVYVCHCGSNIAGTVDVRDVAAYAAKLPHVSVAREYKYMCSSTGQEMIKQDIEQFGLNRVVVAACSPRMHEPTFRTVLAEAGLNAYLLNMANIREHCSWITRDKNVGTLKARQLVSGAVSRVVWQEPLTAREVPVNPTTLIVGGGIAGIQAALSIAEAGYQVFLVEKDMSIGGRMAQLDKTFPTLDCSACILTPKMVQAARHPNITLLTNSEVVEVAGYVGNFQATVRRKARYVDLAKCSGCGECTAVCPVSVPHEFDQQLSQRKAVYRLFPQAIPAAFAIDKKGVAPCRAACPAGVNVQGYVALIRAGKYSEALELIRRDLPFPGVCGRICPHPCEAACTRDGLEGGVSIMALKRFVSDWEREHETPEQRELAVLRGPAARPKGPKVAVVGAGPAGLTCAYQLAKKGYAVSVFEAMPMAGGMMAVGIPEYRLPRDVLEHDIDYIRSHGVEIITNSALGKQFTVDDLLERGFKSVFIAIGAHRGQKMKIPGEDLVGVYDGITFLRRVNTGVWDPKLKSSRRGPVDDPRAVPEMLRGKVVVIGGGNTAVDAARTVLRLGAESVTIVYRRGREEMPVNPWEIAAAEEEGVRLELLAAPIRVLGEGRVSGVECSRMTLGEPDSSGRRRPVPIPDSAFVIPADAVIAAIGQTPELSGAEGLRVTPNGVLWADPNTCETTRPGVFAGGDSAGNRATVVDAVAAGNRAAESIDRYLRGEDILTDRTFGVPDERIVRKQLSEEMPIFPRVQMPELPLGTRMSGFTEVELGYDAGMAQREASRCLDCAVCSECLECVKACSPGAIDHAMKDEWVDLDVGTIILATGHKFYNPTRSPQYHYGRFPNILDSMEFERMCNASGPTGGEILTTDGRIPESIVFIHCVGSRDSHANTYCSRMCCMHAMKQAHLAKERTGADVYELYIDIRAAGKGYEEFYERVQREGVIFIRGRGAEVIPMGGKLVVRAEDTGLGRPIILPVDMVVLVTGMEPHQDADSVAKTFHVTRDRDGFFLEAHPKLRPFNTNTDGIFLAGTCQAPRDIPDTVAHANAAAAEAMSLMGRGKVVIEPTIAEIDAEICSGCRVCNNLCAYSAISYDPERNVSVVNPALCKGCGTCVAACPSGAAYAWHFSEQQIFAEIEGLLAVSAWQPRDPMGSMAEG
jgi:heterodisulfide reductase subunit A